MTTPIPTADTLQAERLPALWDRYEALYGERSKCPNKGWLVRKIIAALEAKAQDAAHAAALDADAPQVAAQALADGTVRSHDEAADLEATLREQAAQEAYSARVTEPAADGATEPEAAPEPAQAPASQLPEILPEAPATDDPWSGATTVAQRIDHIRAIDRIADLEALSTLAKAQGDLQARVSSELAAQTKALAKVEALVADDPATLGTLKVLLGNKRTHARPGVLAAVKARLGALDPDALANAPTTPLADMSLNELRAAYEAEVGRPTDSEHEGYLIWKIREARKGNITTGAIERPAIEGETRVVPIRLGEELLAEVDEAWRREGYPSRVAFIREALVARVKVA